jgi:hypothetical protein
VKALRRSGIPPNMRGKVWEKAIGNRLQMTEKLYAIYTSHAQKNREKTLNDINTHSNARLIGIIKKFRRKFTHKRGGFAKNLACSCFFYEYWSFL